MAQARPNLVHEEACWDSIVDNPVNLADENSLPARVRNQRWRNPSHLTEKRNLGGTMALFSMELDNLQLLFLKELRDLYDAEKQITNALPELIKAAHHTELKDALADHLDVTEQQIARLDR